LGDILVVQVVHENNVLKKDEAFYHISASCLGPIMKTIHHSGALRPLQELHHYSFRLLLININKKIIFICEQNS